MIASYRETMNSQPISILKHKAPFGVDRDGWIRRASEVQSGRACLCVCTECGWPLIAKHRRGVKFTEHFAHAQPSEGEHLPPCSGGLESGVHRMAKQILWTAGYLQLPNFVPRIEMQDIAGHKHQREAPEIPATLYTFTSVELETSIATEQGRMIRPDAIGITEIKGEIKGRLLIEIHFRHPVDSKKIDVARELGFSLLQIDLSSADDQTLASPQRFRALVLDEISNKKWLYHRLAIARAAKLRSELERYVKNVNARIESQRLRSRKIVERRLRSREAKIAWAVKRHALQDEIDLERKRLRRQFENEIGWMECVDFNATQTGIKNYAGVGQQYHPELFLTPDQFFVLRFGDHYSWQRAILSAVDDCSFGGAIDVQQLARVCNDMPWPKKGFGPLYAIKEIPPRTIADVVEDGWFFLTDSERKMLRDPRDPLSRLLEHLNGLGVLTYRNGVLIKALSLSEWAANRKAILDAIDGKRVSEDSQLAYQLELARRKEYRQKAGLYAVWVLASERDAVLHHEKVPGRYGLYRCERCKMVSASADDTTCSHCTNRILTATTIPEMAMFDRYQQLVQELFEDLCHKGGRGFLDQPTPFLGTLIHVLEESLKNRRILAGTENSGTNV